MKIAFFVDAFPDLAVTFIINQIAGLLERGHEVVVFAQRPGLSQQEHPLVRRWGMAQRTHYIGGPSSRLRRLGSVASAFAACPTRATTLTRALPPFSKGREGTSLRTFSAAVAFIDGLDFDVIHCHFGPNGNVATRIRELGLLKGPIVTTFHGYDMRMGAVSNGECYAPLRRAGEAFLAISGQNRRTLLQWGFDRNRIFDHPVGVDPELFPYRGERGDQDETVRVLCVANLVPVKGHLYLLRALASLRESNPELQLDVRLVGEGPERTSLQRAISQLGLSNVVSLLGALDQTAVRTELQVADFFVLPSLAEATPVALMEAQCVGLPVIATRVGAIDEVVAAPESGILVEPGDPAALANAMATLISKRNRWEAMGRSGHAHVCAHYDIHELLNRLENIYRRVAEQYLVASPRKKRNAGSN